MESSHYPKQHNEKNKKEAQIIKLLLKIIKKRIKKNLKSQGRRFFRYLLLAEFKNILIIFFFFF